MGLGCAGVAFSAPSPAPAPPAAQNRSNGFRLRRGRFVLLLALCPRPLLPRIVPMVVGCSGVAFSASGPAPAHPAAQNCSNGRRLLRDRTFCSLLCARRPWRLQLPSTVPMAVGCTGVAFSAPGPAPRALGAPTCPQLFQQLLAAQGEHFCSWLCARVLLAPPAAQNYCNGC